MKYVQKKKGAKKFKLDVKDRKILSILSENVRIPLTQLSKKVGLSRDAVDYRIKNYEKEGVIQGYRVVVDIGAFSYINCHLFIRLNNPDRHVEARIIERITKHPYIRAVIKFSGRFDFEIALVTKSLLELDEHINRMAEDFEGTIQESEILTIVKPFFASVMPTSFYHGWDSGNRNDKKLNGKIKFDEKDIQILKILSENAKKPLYEISSDVKMSADAVSYRIKNLMGSGIIRQFVPVINYASLDYNLYALLVNINNLDDKKEKLLKDFLSNNKNILWAVKTLGKYNVLIYVLVKDTEELQDTLLSLRNLFPKQINNYETLIAYEEYKYVYFPAGLF